MTDRTTTHESSRYPSPAAAYYALFFLLLCYFLYFVD